VYSMLPPFRLATVANVAQLTGERAAVPVRIASHPSARQVSQKPNLLIPHPQEMGFKRPLVTVVRRNKSGF
jgi:hypothetical protein